MSTTINRIFLLITLIISSLTASAQMVDNVRAEKINVDSLRADYDKGPYFGMYKDNYFIFGPSIGSKPTRENTNVKFQISIQQKLTRSTLPWGTYLYLYYTQKVFWNILQESLPMTDLNFNPGLGLAKPLFSNGRYLGKLTLQIEHESNGRDSIWSRSWNRLTFGASIWLDEIFMVHGKVWVPFIDSGNNKDLLKYYGIFQFGTQFMTYNRKCKFGLMLMKRQGWNLNFNFIGEVSYNFSKKSDWGLYLQYYNGYGEGLLDYNKFHSQLRLGVIFRPLMFSDY
ncbi:MAG: phospholipase A [Muribaculaceae bacterium]|nr:phospholipase A [Muribaculaceae bacterium]MDE5844814.1 phospholipase A [Muribaculaceae bacterium]